jgi:hypothetical protein
MASEPITFWLHKEGDFNGQTPIELDRSKFAIEGGRVYRAHLTGPAGQISADFFGVFSDLTPKLCGIASSSYNPQSVARIIPKDDPDVFREEVDLTPQMVHVVMYPGDRSRSTPKTAGASVFRSWSPSSPRASTSSLALAPRPSRSGGAFA